MQQVERKRPEELTVKSFLARARDWVDECWVTNSFYEANSLGTDDLYEDSRVVVAEEGGLLYGKLITDNVYGVCAVGAMRVAFAEIVDIPPSGEDELGEYWYESTILEHPLYQEGMRVLGRAFYEAEQAFAAEWEEGLDHVLEPGEADKLLNGDGGRPWTVRDVSKQIVELNDNHFDKTWIMQAFEAATASAPDRPLVLG